MSSSPELKTLSDLRGFVHEKLCEQENLLPELFPLQEDHLTRNGKPCGIQFLLFGPRNVRLGAIWDSQHNTLYFYDAQGNRFLKLTLRGHLTAGSA